MALNHPTNARFYDTASHWSPATSHQAPGASQQPTSNCVNRVTRKDNFAHRTTPSVSKSSPRDSWMEIHVSFIFFFSYSSFFLPFRLEHPHHPSSYSRCNSLGWGRLWEAKSRPKSYTRTRAQKETTHVHSRPTHQLGICKMSHCPGCDFRAGLCCGNEPYTVHWSWTGPPTTSISECFIFLYINLTQISANTGVKMSL